MECPFTFIGVCIFERPSCLIPSALIISFSGPKKPRARKTSWAGKNLSDPGTSSIFHRPPLSFVHSTRTRSTINTWIKSRCRRTDLYWDPWVCRPHQQRTPSSIYNIRGDLVLINQYTIITQCQKLHTVSEVGSYLSVTIIRAENTICILLLINPRIFGAQSLLTEATAAKGYLYRGKRGVVVRARSSWLTWLRAA